MKQLEGNYVIDVNEADWLAKAQNQLDTVGVLVLRNIMPVGDIDGLVAKSKAVLSRPAISGSIGYYMKDPNKKLFDCYLLGREAVSAITNNKLIDLFEAYFKREVVMSDGCLKHDLGNDRVYFPYHSHTGPDLALKDDGPFGCGMMVYLHDTDVGAFCYCPGTHKWNSPHGADPYKYPEPMRSQIVEGIRRVSGKRGDFVIFDGRGFHGPEQPVPVPRTVLLTAYNPIDLCPNGAMRYGSPILVTDLTGLDMRQLRVLGVGLKSAVPFERFHLHSFNKSRGFRIMAFMLEAWFKLARVVDRIKDNIRGLMGRKVAYDAGDV
jgi:hypothetical protein